MIIKMLHHLTYMLILFVVRHTTEQYLLGTHFYVNQENILIDNTLKTVSTLARPYDLVAFIGQSERLARIDHLQTYIDAVDDADELTSQQQSDKLDSDTQENNENINKCYHFMDNGESLIFKILKTNPELFEIKRRPYYQELPLKKFPFVIIYEIYQEESVGQVFS